LGLGFILGPVRGLDEVDADDCRGYGEEGVEEEVAAAAAVVVAVVGKEGLTWEGVGKLMYDSGTY